MEAAGVASVACRSRAELLDLQLARLCRTAGALRLQMGAGLEALAVQGGHHRMGFSSLEAYALERCERSARWVQEARALARRLASLPGLRRALASGRIGWSMATVVAPVATPDDEGEWLRAAQRHTVRQMRALAAESRAQVPAPAERRCRLTVTVDRTDAWLFECTRMIVRRVSGERADEAVVEALLAEGTSSLAPFLPRGAHGAAELDDRADDAADGLEAAQRAWEAERARQRDQAEALCESRLLADRAHGLAASGPDASDPDGQDSEEPDFGGAPEAIDAELRRLSAELARRDVRIGQLAESLWRADGWRRLGYATAAQYARERLGVHVTSIEAKRQLARRLETLPYLAAAVARREVGYEAARLLARVATPTSEQALLARAAERTVVQLREELDAMQLLTRTAGRPHGAPPSESLMHALSELERHVIRGDVFQGAGVPQSDEGSRDATPGAVARRASGTDPERPGIDAAPTSRRSDRADRAKDAAEMSAALFAALARAEVETRHRAGVGGLGRVTLRLWVSEETRRQYRRLERGHRLHGPSSCSFFGFLCRALISTWNAALDTGEAYADIYARDGYRCRSPVCTRRDVTPHHLRYRSAGGDDREDNLVALCVWCHLEGIHGGRLRASPPASAARWTIGSPAHTIVEGRRRSRLPDAARRESPRRAA